MRHFLGKLFPPLPLIFPAVLSGVLVALCFPTANFGPLVFVALVPVFYAFLRHQPSPRDAYKTGFLFGCAVFFSMLWWIVKLIPTADVTIPWLMTPALIILVLYLALYPAFFFLLLRALRGTRPAAFLLMAPSLWVLLEVVRARGELAFPWGSLGYALSGAPVLIQGASLFGLFGLSLIVVAVNALAVCALRAGGVFARLAATAAALVVVAAMVLLGRAHMDAAGEIRGEPLRVAVVQPNVDLAVKWKREYRDTTFALIERLAGEAADRGAELILFPETCATVYIDNAPKYKSRLHSLATRVGVPFYIGFLDHRRGEDEGEVIIYNSSGLFMPDGSLHKYAKNHLLPFGEALPLSTRLRWIQKINFGQANFEPGPIREPLESGKTTFTPLICFESVFPYLCRDGVDRGAELLVNITNDGWFSDTPGPYQHAQMCILRAVEFRRYLVRSANTGVSMVVAPTGEVTHALDLYTDGMIVTEVASLEGETPYARRGDWPVVAASLALLVAGAVWARVRPAPDRA